MKTRKWVGMLSLLGMLLAVGVLQADPVFSDRMIITRNSDGKVIVDATRNESTPNLPEFAITSGQLRIPHNANNVSSGIILVEPDDNKTISDYLRLTVFHGKKHDHLYITFTSDRDEKALKLPKDFPKDAPRIVETGNLQDVTALLFPLYAKANQQAPFDVQIQSDVEKAQVADLAPEPSSLTLLGMGVLAVGGYIWRARRKKAA